MSKNIYNSDSPTNMLEFKKSIMTKYNYTEAEFNIFVEGYLEALHTLQGRTQTSSEEEFIPCKYWVEGHHFIKDMDTCIGTREQDPCDCKGNRRKCNYY